MIWKTTAVRGQCPFPRSSFMGPTILPINARPGSWGRQAQCQDRCSLNSPGRLLSPQLGPPQPLHPQLGRPAQGQSLEMRRQGKEFPSQSPGPHKLADLPGSRTQATVLAALSGCRTGREMTRFCLLLHLGFWGGRNGPWLGLRWPRSAECRSRLGAQPQKDGKKSPGVHKTLGLSS